MSAEVTWNGIAKTYRVGTKSFVQNRMQIVDDPDVIAYLKMTKDFTVIDIPEAKAKAKPEPEAKAEPAGEPSANEGSEPRPRGPRLKPAP
jgi:hypothetical protein